jgi:hypothetical protein
MRGIWHGRKYSVIARELGISSHTVETHARHIKAKLGVSSLMEAIHRIYAVLFEEERARIREELKAEGTTVDAPGSGGDGGGESSEGRGPIGPPTHRQIGNQTRRSER